MGHCRGGLTKKIHALVDAERRPIRFKLTLGQAGGAPVGTELVPDSAPGAPLIADRANDTNPIREGAASRGIWADIPPRVIRKDAFSFSSRVCRQRNLVERFFNRIQRLRGLVPRCDRRPDNHLAALKLASIRIRIAGK